jgi:hypothetical protein
LWQLRSYEPSATVASSAIPTTSKALRMCCLFVVVVCVLKDGSFFCALQ